MSFQFPNDFYWGAATSAHQVEGNNHNDWAEWEKSESRIKNLESRIKKEDFIKQSPEHLFKKWPAPLDLENYISGRACDHYSRFREDFDIAKSLGHNAHRFSIEWSRIEPEEGKFNEKEIEHYREVIRALRERRIEPFVTLWHWPFPIWVANQGGWENKKTVNDFAIYCERIAGALRDQVKFWVVLNEPGYWFVNAYVTKKFPAPKQSLFAPIRAYMHMIRAHKKVYKKMKDINKEFFIGIVESTGWIAPETLRWVLHDIRNFIFPWFVKNYFDFFGLNYYRRAPIIGGNLGDVSEIGWEIYPEGLYQNIRGAYSRFGKPIFITENGIADSQDLKRTEFIKTHLQAVARAVTEGIDVRSYFYWSLLDNFEWDSGFWPRFGLVGVDYKTMERKIRPSAFEYAKICKENKLEI